MFKIIQDEIDRGNAKETVVADNDTLSELATEMANRLFTVCAVFREYPYI